MSTNSGKGLKLLYKEIQTFLAKPLEGIEIIEDETDIFILHVLLTGPSGCPFEGGKFKVKLTFTEEYPEIPPKGHFITSIFHPNVSPTTGDICVSTLQKDWKSNLGLPHLLLTIKSLLMTPNPESALNEAAGKLFMDDFEEFCKRAKLLTQIHTSKSLNNQENCKDQVKSILPVKNLGSNSLNDTRKKLRKL